jgi:hypothetical protein
MIPNILWSKGPIRDDYSSFPTESTVNQQYIINRLINIDTILWIRNTSQIFPAVTDLDVVSKNLMYIKTPVILITSDGDRSVPSSYQKDVVDRLLQSDKIMSWYTQNYDGSIVHKKLKHIPIGMDLHTSQWLINNSIYNKIMYLIEKRKEPVNKIKNRIFLDAHLSVTHPERLELFNLIKNNKHINYLREHVTIQNITNMYNKYQFVISPRGNGIDCHRTWELFLAGCIVITKTSSLDYMFISNDLPVVILNDWSELICDDLDKKLEIWYQKYISFTSMDHIYPKMSFDYWIYK